MKKVLLRTLAITTATVLIGCAASQFTLYRPSEDEPAWRITVVKQPIIDQFVCSIDDSEVVVGSFGIFNDNFEVDGIYQGKSVKLAGYRASRFTTGSEGQTNVSYSYQIRVFIDENEVGVFEF